MQAESLDKSTYPVLEAARILCISKGAFYEAVRRGQVPTFKINNRLRVPRAWIEQQLMIQV